MNDSTRIAEQFSQHECESPFLKMIILLGFAITMGSVSFLCIIFGLMWMPHSDGRVLLLASIAFELISAVMLMFALGIWYTHATNHAIGDRAARHYLIIQIGGIKQILAEADIALEETVQEDWRIPPPSDPRSN